MPVSLTAADFTTTMLWPVDDCWVAVAEGRARPIPETPPRMPPADDPSWLRPTMTLLGRILPPLACCLLRNLGESPIGLSVYDMYGRSESEQTLIGGETGRESQMYADEGVPVEKDGPDAVPPGPSSRLREDISVAAIVLPRCSFAPAADERVGVGVAFVDCVRKLPERSVPGALLPRTAPSPCCSWDCSEPMVDYG
uniref:(northern house mosquito) hypothetical protein n=1 Tax=Culex pipiens TaxID=7175 RepID=A0A8D8L1H7_CULPI